MSSIQLNSWGSIVYAQCIFWVKGWSVDDIFLISRTFTQGALVLFQVYPGLAKCLKCLNYATALGISQRNCCFWHLGSHEPDNFLSMIVNIQCIYVYINIQWFSLSWFGFIHIALSMSIQYIISRYTISSWLVVTDPPNSMPSSLNARRGSLERPLKKIMSFQVGLPRWANDKKQPVRQCNHHFSGASC